MNFFTHWPLKWKVIAGIMLASAIAVVLASAIFVNVEKTRLNEAMVEDTTAISKIIAGNIKGALQFEDKDAATEALRSLTAKSHIQGAIAYSAKGDVFASFFPDAKSSKRLPAGFPSKPSRDGVEYTDDYIAVTHTIESGDENVGTLYLRVGLNDLREVQAQFLRIGVMVTIASAVVALLLGLLIQRAITLPVKNVVNALRDIAEGEGDLTRRLPVNSNDELGELATWFNRFVEKVHGVTCTFRDNARELSGAADSLEATTRKTTEGIIRQQEEISQVASAITEMAGTVQEVSRNVGLAANDAETADRNASQGKKIVDETMRAIEKLAEDIERASVVITKLQKESDNIGAVLEVIGGIAEQTNLLALNAAIEAARAGEQGRGFAVVADEVRTLASRTQKSTQEIKEMIDRLQVGAKEAVSVMEQGRAQASSSVDQAERAGEALTLITNAVSVIRDMTQQIASASEEQNAVTEEINKSIVSISQVANQTSDDSTHISRGSKELAQLSGKMEKLISQFRL
jgi:methyl-accepting chemotaxis protein